MVRGQRPLVVCLVAGNCLVTSYLRQILREHHSIRALTLERYLRLSPDQRKNTVFVIDLCGLEVPWVEMLRHLRTHCLNARFLLIDREKSTEQIGRLLLMGAQGFLSHGEVSRRLVRAIFIVAANQFWAPPEALQEFLREAASALRKDAHGRQTITPREAEIVDLVHRRLSNREIAQLLKIQVSTVKFHVSNILSKMHARNRHDLVETPSELLSRILPS